MNDWRAKAEFHYKNSQDTCGVCPLCGAMAALEAAEKRERRLHKALAFAASAIKSGESWTPTCEYEIGVLLREVRAV